MPTCKQCETNYSLWTAFGDGLCKPCHEKITEEATQQEAEKRERVFADAKVTIDSIVRSIAGDEPPVCVAFLNAGVKKITESMLSSGFLKKLPGLVGGLAMGGVAGQMLFGGTLFSGNPTFAGELGILVVTPTRVLIGYRADTPFATMDAYIIPDHLQLLQAECNSNTIATLVCPIQSSQFTATNSHLSIVCGEKAMEFRRSELFVDNAIYSTLSLQDIYKQIKQLETRPTPYEFVAQLLAGQNPLPDNQVDEAIGEATYMKALGQAIFGHGKRDALFQRLTDLPPSLKAALEQQLRAKADAYQSTRVKLIVWTLLSVVAIIGVVFTQGFVCFLYVVGMIVAVFVSLENLENLSRSVWCRTVMKD